MPDVGGAAARLDALVEALSRLARRRAELEVVQVGNGHGEDDIVAGGPPTDDDGHVNSYRRLLNALGEQEQRLARAYPEELKRVREIVAERDRLRLSS